MSIALYWTVRVTFRVGCSGAAVTAVKYTPEGFYTKNSYTYMSTLLLLWESSVKVPNQIHGSEVVTRACFSRPNVMECDRLTEEFPYVVACR
jgi:hypothetical protein